MIERGELNKKKIFLLKNILQGNTGASSGERKLNNRNVKIFSKFYF